MGKYYSSEKNVDDLSNFAIEYLGLDRKNYVGIINSYFHCNIPEFVKAYAYDYDGHVTFEVCREEKTDLLLMNQVDKSLKFTSEEDWILDTIKYGQTAINFASGKDALGEFLEKQQITSSWAIHEVNRASTLYTSGDRGCIESYIYSLDQLDRAIRTIEGKLGTKVSTNMSFVGGVMELADEVPKHVVSVMHTPNGIVASLSDENGTVENIYLNGCNLYDAYYDYMIRCGFFAEPIKNQKNFKKN